jgi:hypothetical protein
MIGTTNEGLRVDVPLPLNILTAPEVEEPNGETM